MKKISFFKLFCGMCVGAMVSFPCHAQQQVECRRVFKNMRIATESSLYEGKKTSALVSELKRVKVLDSLKKREGHLRTQGVREYYTAGLDEVIKLQALARALKSGRVDPENTHIVDFADQVENHIAFFNVGVLDPLHKVTMSLNPDNRKAKLRWEDQFADLARQARLRVKEKKLTYKFWVEFNYRLAALSQGMDFGEERTRGFRILKNFPDYVYLPTIKELGVMAFNHVDTQGIILIGLINKPVEVDGVLFYPEKFFHHDAVHYRYGTKKLRSEEKEFHQNWFRKVQKLSPRQRERVELVYFLMSHETSHPKPAQYSEKSYITQKVLENVERFHYKQGAYQDMHHLLPPEVSADLISEIETWLKQSAEDFVKTAKNPL